MQISKMPLLVAVFFALVVMGLAGSVEAVPPDCVVDGWQCGCTVGPLAGTQVIPNDIGPCALSPAVTLMGPVTVDANGHHISCETDDTHVGVYLDGSGATFRNAHVSGCDIGVQVAGAGNHKVENVAAVSTAAGFKVDSDHNKANNCSAVGTTLRVSNVGFAVFGNSNELKNDTVTSVDSSFFATGAGNKFESDTAFGPGIYGFYLGNASNSKVSKSTATFIEYGFIDYDGSQNEFSGNTAGSAEYGFYSYSGGPTLSKFKENVAVGSQVGIFTATGISTGLTTSIEISKNTVSGNHGTGILVTTDGNTVKENRAFGNALVGIRLVSDAESNTVTKNIALGNGLDLEDDNTLPDCDGNSWTADVFGTSNAACIH